jgi:hypothetical protein
MSRYLCFAAVCVAMVGCSGRSGTDTDRSADALDVFEAVFRRHFPKPSEDFKAYLTIDGKDPSAELMKRLRRDWPNLKPGSEEPKEKGHRFYVDELTWTGRDSAEVKSGYWFPTKFAGEGGFGDYHLIRKAEGWVVEKVMNEVMS